MRTKFLFSIFAIVSIILTSGFGLCTMQNEEMNADRSLVSINPDMDCSVSDCGMLFTVDIPTYQRFSKINSVIRIASAPLIHFISGVIINPVILNQDLDYNNKDGPHNYSVTNLMPDYMMRALSRGIIQPKIYT